MNASDAVTAGPDRSLVTFRLDRQTYALPLEAVLQIVEMVTITPIPQLDHGIAGVINVRGTPMPVLDARRLLGLPAAPRQLHTPIILAQAGTQPVGLIVDEVLAVLTLPAREIARPSEFLPPGLEAAACLHGLLIAPNGTVLLIDLDRLFVPVAGSLPASVPEVAA